MFLIKNPKYKVFVISLRDIEKVLVSKKEIDIAKLLLKEYYEFLEVFLRKDLDKLPSYQFYNYKIKLIKS